MMTADLSHSYPPLRLIDKLVFVAALAVTVALFLTVGWLAIAPDDPHGAVSLVTHRQAGLMIVQAAALTAVTSAIVTVMIGTKLADAGVFASALGLALVTLRGDTAAYLLINVAQGNRSVERALAGKLALEGVIWFAVLVLAMVVSALVMRWCFGGDWRSGTAANEGRADQRAPSSPRATLTDMSISECPFLSSLAGVAGSAAATNGSRWAGLKAFVVITVVAVFVFSVLVSGSSPRAIQHGQICFAVFVAFYVGVWVSKRSFPCRTAFWGLVSPAATCVVGYLWTMTLGESSSPYPELASVPVSDFLRALPMTFIAVGSLGVLTAHWTVDVPAPKSKPAKAKSKPRRFSRR